MKEASDETRRVGGPPLGADLRLNAALLCERVLEEKDGTVSVIRIAERLKIDIAGTFPRGDKVALGIPVVLLLVFKRESEEASEYVVAVTATTPAGREIPIVETELAIVSGRGKGADLILSFTFPVTGHGLYWVSVTADEQLLTRVPIEVVVAATPTSA